MCLDCAQSYGEEPLVAMLAWLRDAARQVAHGELWRPPLLDSLEAREYTQVCSVTHAQSILRTSSQMMRCQPSVKKVLQARRCACKTLVSCLGVTPDLCL